MPYEEETRQAAGDDSTPDPPSSRSEADSTSAPGPHETMISGEGSSHEPGSGSADSGGAASNPSGPSRDARTNSVESWIGRSIGKYRIEAHLGSGGMGIVYRAHDTTIERDVALKFLSEELTADGEALERFLAEARSAGKLNHPNAVTVYDVAREQSLYFIVMEYVAGGSAADFLRGGGRFLPVEATHVIADACRGIAAAHAQHFVHRDIKPANLLRTPDGDVKVADFGLAKATASTTQGITQAGQVIGTPYFMSPEQCEAKTVDHRSDIYSLGATYYSLLTAVNPYKDAGTSMQVMFAHCQGEVPDPTRENPSVPRACADLVARAMAKRPEDRFQSAEEMLAALESVSASISGDSLRASHEGGFGAEALDVTVATPSSPSAATVSGRAEGHASKPAAKTRWILGGLSIAIAVLAVLAVFWIRSGGHPPWIESHVAAAPSGDPIKVGILHSLSGTMAGSEAPVVDATLLAIEELNERGGVLGRPVEAVIRDGQSNPETFAAEAEDLITNAGVGTVFGCWTSATRRTVLPVFERLDHLLFYPVQYEGIEESPNIIYLGATPNQQIIPAVHWAFSTLEKRRFFLVGSDYVFPRAANAIIADVVHELGAELVGEAYMPLGSLEAHEVVAKIVEAEPDIILSTINGDTNVAFFSSLRHVGVLPENVPTISFSIAEEELRYLHVDKMVGDYAAWSYFQCLDSEENLQFVARFREKYGSRRVVTEPMEAAYVGVQLWAEAVEDAESVDIEDVRHSMRNRRFDAPEGQIRIDSNTQHTFKTPRVGRIAEGGQFEVVWTADEPIAPDPYPGSRTTEEWKAFLHDIYTSWGDNWQAPNEEDEVASAPVG